jgi:uncharacterized membrane protein
MVIKNLENKVKLVTIICSLFLVGCVLISISSIWTAKNMVVDAQNKIYVLDGNVPILVQRTTMDETLDVEAKSHIDMFSYLPPIPSPPLIWACGRFGFRYSVVCILASCFSATLVLKRSKIK